MSQGTVDKKVWKSYMRDNSGSCEISCIKFCCVWSFFQGSRGADGSPGSIGVEGDEVSVFSLYMQYILLSFVGHSLEKLKTWRENTGVETFKSIASRSHLKLTLVLTWQLQEIWSVLASSAKLNSKMLVRGYLYPAKADFNSIIGGRSVCSLNFPLIQVALV